MIIKLNSWASNALLYFVQGYYLWSCHTVFSPCACACYTDPQCLLLIVAQCKESAYVNKTILCLADADQYISSLIRCRWFLFYKWNFTVCVRINGLVDNVIRYLASPKCDIWRIWNWYLKSRCVLKNRQTKDHNTSSGVECLLQIMFHSCYKDRQFNNVRYNLRYLIYLYKIPFR